MKAQTIKASREGLIKIQEAREKSGLTVDSDRWLEQASKVLNPHWKKELYYAPNISEGTWRRFLYGTARINAEAFKAYCQVLSLDWQQLCEQRANPENELSISFYAYDNGWVGREKLIVNLKSSLQSSCRILVITGITGIGKTALAERLAIELQSDWLLDSSNNFVQENFDVGERSDFASVAMDWLQTWGQTVTSEERKDTQHLLNRVVKRLQEHQYLVLLDSLELILKGNEDEGWSGFQDEWWAKFLASLLAAGALKSRVIITSQELPEQIPRYHNFWHCQFLSGLTELERLLLFEKTGIDVNVETPHRNYLERIGTVYEGHPLALRVIAGELVNQPFYGNVVAYWKKYGKEIEEVEKAIEEARIQGITQFADDDWRLAQYSRNLRKYVRSRLQKTFERLEKDVYYAYLLLCSASVYRCPVPEDYWLNLLQQDCDDKQRQIALDALHERYLVEEVVEKSQYFLRQHNLVRSVALEHLKQMD